MKSAHQIINRLNHDPKYCNEDIYIEYSDISEGKKVRRTSKYSKELLENNSISKDSILRFKLLVDSRTMVIWDKEKNISLL